MKYVERLVPRNRSHSDDSSSGGNINSMASVEYSDSALQDFRRFIEQPAELDDRSAETYYEEAVSALSGYQYGTISAALQMLCKSAVRGYVRAYDKMEELLDQGGETMDQVLMPFLSIYRDYVDQKTVNSGIEYRYLGWYWYKLYHYNSKDKDDELLDLAALAWLEGFE